MGLGGDLLWTPVLRALNARNGGRVRLLDRPLLSDFLHGVPYNRSSARQLSPIFRNNPFVEMPTPCRKGVLAQRLDRLGEMLTGFNRSRSWIESACYNRAVSSSFEFIYLDLPQHNYVERIEHDRYIWKKGGHIIDILAASVGLNDVPHQCEIFFEPSENVRVEQVSKEKGLTSFITIEPNTNTGYFGDLRAWSFERWQEVVDWMKRERPGITVVQVGAAGGRILDGVVDMCGALSFRETAILIGHSRLYLGTEGGLMHAANAVKARALIVWGGLTDPSFAGYPERDEIVHIGAPCAPCGLLGQCPSKHRCMREIEVKQVVNRLQEVIG